MGRNLARNWWLVVAVLTGVVEVFFGIALAVQDRDPGAWFGGAVFVLAGLVVLAGVAWRRRARIAGDLVVAGGVLPLLPFWWMVVPSLLALVVLVAAVLDAADARSLGRSARPAGAGLKLGLAILAVLAAMLVARVVIGAGGLFPFIGVAVAAVLAAAVAGLSAWAGRRRPRRAV